MIGTDGHGGAIGFLYEQIKKETEERKSADLKIATDLDGVKTRVNYASAAVGTVGVIAGFMAKVGLSKFALLFKP
jgi:hypothetical protein